MITVSQNADLGDILIDGCILGDQIPRLGLGVLVINDIIEADERPENDFYIDITLIEGTRYNITVRLCEDQHDVEELQKLERLLGDTVLPDDTYHFKIAFKK